jgi:cell division protein FtsQ
MPLALLVLLIVAGLAVAATWPGFTPKQVWVVGNHVVSSREILARAGIARGRSIWLQDTRGIARRIEGIPYVATASVHRIPPASMRITVSERAPFAILQSGPESAMVDRALRVLGPATEDEERPVLIVPAGLALWPGEFVTAREAVALRDAYGAISERRIIPLSLTLDRYGGLVITVRGGLRLLLGPQSDLAQKLTLVDAILAQVVHGQRRIAAIDVRAPGTPVVVYR